MHRGRWGRHLIYPLAKFWIFFFVKNQNKWTKGPPIFSTLMTLQPWSSQKPTPAPISLEFQVSTTAHFYYDYIFDLFVFSEGDFMSLPPEPQQGNIEYKLKLVNPSNHRLEHLVTQMKWRLREGQGLLFAIHEIGQKFVEEFKKSFEVGPKNFSLV